MKNIQKVSYNKNLNVSKMLLIINTIIGPSAKFSPRGENFSLKFFSGENFALKIFDGENFALKFFIGEHFSLFYVLGKFLHLVCFFLILLTTTVFIHCEFSR